MSTAQPTTPPRSPAKKEHANNGSKKKGQNQKTTANTSVLGPAKTSTVHAHNPYMYCVASGVSNRFQEEQRALHLLQYPTSKLLSVVGTMRRVMTPKDDNDTAADQIGGAKEAAAVTTTTYRASTGEQLRMRHAHEQWLAAAANSSSSSNTSGNTNNSSSDSSNQASCFTDVYEEELSRCHYYYSSYQCHTRHPAIHHHHQEQQQHVVAHPGEQPQADELPDYHGQSTSVHPSSRCGQQHNDCCPPHHNPSDQGQQQRLHQFVPPPYPPPHEQRSAGMSPISPDSVSTSSAFLTTTSTTTPNGKHPAQQQHQPQRCATAVSRSSASPGPLYPSPSPCYDHCYDPECLVSPLAQAYNGDTTSSVSNNFSQQQQQAATCDNINNVSAAAAAAALCKCTSCWRQQQLRSPVSPLALQQQPPVRRLAHSPYIFNRGASPLPSSSPFDHGSQPCSPTTVATPQHVVNNGADECHSSNSDGEVPDHHNECQPSSLEASAEQKNSAANNAAAALQQPEQQEQGDNQHEEEQGGETQNEPATPLRSSSSAPQPQQQHDGAGLHSNEITNQQLTNNQDHRHHHVYHNGINSSDLHTPYRHNNNNSGNSPHCSDGATWTPGPCPLTPLTTTTGVATPPKKPYDVTPSKRPSAPSQHSTDASGPARGKKRGGKRSATPVTAPSYHNQNNQFFSSKNNSQQSSSGRRWAEHFTLNRRANNASRREEDKAGRDTMLTDVLNHCAITGSAALVYHVQHGYHHYLYYSAGIFEPGSFVVTAGDRGEDIGVVRRCSVVHKDNWHMLSGLPAIFREATAEEVEYRTHSIELSQTELIETIGNLTYVADSREPTVTNVQNMQILGCDVQLDCNKVYVFYHDKSPKGEHVHFKSLAKLLFTKYHCRMWMQCVRPWDLIHDLLFVSPFASAQRSGTQQQQQQQQEHGSKQQYPLSVVMSAKELGSLVASCDFFPPFDQVEQGEEGQLQVKGDVPAAVAAVDSPASSQQQPQKWGRWKTAPAAESACSSSSSSQIKSTTTTTRDSKAVCSSLPSLADLPEGRLHKKKNVRG